MRSGISFGRGENIKAADLLGLKNIHFLEPNFESLIDDSFTDQILLMETEESIFLVDENDWPLAFGIREGGRWTFINFVVRQPPQRIFSAFERIGGRVFQEEWEVWMAAVREFYSIMLLKDNSPSVEDYSTERLNKVQSLVEEVWGKGKGEKCLDVGCGSGIGSVALRRLGYTPLSYDNDPSQLSLGLLAGRLEPSETMCLNGAVASRYIAPTPLAICLMAGTIEHTSSWFWERIIDQMLVIGERALVTVGMRKEADFIESWAESRGRAVDLFENERDPFYDRWVCIVGK